MKNVETLEGRTRLFVPKVSLEKREPPTTPVFFNPAAAVNRDISVAITEASSGISFCDALAGVGSRGIRVAREVRRTMQVALVDFNAESLRLARRSAKLNGVGRKCNVVHHEANSYLYSRFGRDEKFDFLDIDPFGTPVPYIQSAFSAISAGGILSFTATDTAVLCGVYPRVAKRRYGASTLNNAFHHETAVRVLVDSCRRLAAALDIGIAPLAAHATRHYVRVYMRADVGATKADATAAHEGYVMECRACRHIFSADTVMLGCVKCGGRVSHAGPLWVGSLVDEPLVKQAVQACERLGYSEAAETLGSLTTLDAFPPYGYSIEAACSSLGIASVAPSKVVSALASMGFRSGVQPFEKSGLKTDATYRDVVAAVKEASA
ncbi:MAG: methyltransferase domain-containing protein [Nitrososphaerales archaeon]|nr:methyltransferase domain-containing protein [Nitrososphaerales archaeon]